MSQPVRSSSSNQAAIDERLATKAADMAGWEGRRADREPCPRCGTRADNHHLFGCHHGRGR